MKFLKQLLIALSVHLIPLHAMELMDTAAQIAEQHPLLIATAGLGVSVYQYQKSLKNFYEQRHVQQHKEFEKKIEKISSDEIKGTLYSVPGQVKALVLDEKNSYILSGENDTLRIRSLKHPEIRLHGIKYETSDPKNNIFIRSIDLSEKTGLCAIAYAKNKSGFILIGSMQYKAESPFNKIKELRGHTDRVIDVKFSPNGSLLASISDDKTIQIWNTKTWTINHIIQSLDGSSLSFNADGSQLASGSLDGMVHIWNTQTGERIQSYRVNKKMHVQENIIAVKFHPKNKNKLFATCTNGVALIDTKSQSITQLITQDKLLITNLNVSSANDELLMRDDSGNIHILDLDDNTIITIQQPTENEHQSFCPVIMNPNTKQIITGYKIEIPDYKKMQNNSLLTKLLSFWPKKMNALFTTCIGKIAIFDHPKGNSFIIH